MPCARSCLIGLATVGVADVARGVASELAAGGVVVDRPQADAEGLGDLGSGEARRHGECNKRQCLKSSTGRMSAPADERSPNWASG